jgi:hypothetical protein
MYCDPGMGRFASRCGRRRVVALPGCVVWYLFPASATSIARRVDGCNGSCRGLWNFASRIVNTPVAGSKSPRSRPSASPRRSPVANTSPMNVCMVAAASGERSRPAAAIKAATSASERRGAPGAWRQQIHRWHFDGRIEGLHPAGEAAHHAEPLRMPGRGGTRREGGPLHRQLCGDRVGVGRLGEVDELLEQQPRAGKLETQRATDAEIVDQRATQAAHRAPVGHGRITVDSAA